MIRFIDGDVLDINANENAIVLVTYGVGYEVRLVPGEIRRLTLNPGLRKRYTVYVYASTRESGTTLYGFLSSFDRAVFAKLVAIDGVGPVSAMALMDEPGAEQVRRAVERRDHKALLVAKGIGPKLAQRIVTEMGQ